MFWKKKKETNNSMHVLLIETHLSGGMPLIKGKLTNPSTRIAVQIFILGMADMLRQADNLPWEEYISICKSLFQNHNLIPPMGVEEFIEIVSQKVGANEEVAKIMRYGAQSIEMYFVEKDANAPMDLLSVAVFAEKNADNFSGI